MKHFLLAILGLSSLVVLGSPEEKLQDPAQAPDGDPAELLREVQNTLRVLNRISDALPREPLEPRQLVEHVLGRGGKDAEKLTQWVADSVGWLPYRGALRGPRGVLIERRGNSLDQSLLLAEALRATGREVRLARAQLDVELAGQIHAAVRPLGGTKQTPAASALARLGLDGFAQQIGADPAQLRQASDALQIQGQRYLERVLPLTVRQTQDLKRALAENEVEAPPVEPGALAASEVEALRDHWWVQSSEDGQAWQDHDPLALRSGVDPAVTPQATCAPDELPREAEHALVLRIVAERSAPEGRSAAVLLRHAAKAKDLAGGHFEVSFLPVDAIDAAPPGPGELESGQYTLRTAGESTEWLPMLTTFDYAGTADDIYEASVRTDGTTNPKPELDAKNRKVSGAISALDGSDDSALAVDSHLTAVWIEYELTAPGRPKQVIRRSVFDLLGEARRASRSKFELAEGMVRSRGLALSGLTQILPATCRLSSDFVIRLDLATKLKNQRLIVQLAQARKEGKTPSVPDLATQFANPPLELVVLARMRLSVGRHAERVCLDGVNVFANHVQPFEPTTELAREQAAAGGSPALATGRAVDIVANGVGVLAPPADAENPAGAWDVRLEQGVLDTVLENLALLGLDESASKALESDEARASNTAAWMERHPIAEWRVFGPQAELDAAASDTHARAADALASGLAAVLPGAALADAPEDAWKPGCWWRVDPTTGETLGIGPRGWGQEMAERAATARANMMLHQPVKGYAGRLICFVAAASLRVGLGLVAGTVGTEMGASLTVSAVMAAVAQAGYTGAAFNWIQDACTVLLLG